MANKTHDDATTHREPRRTIAKMLANADPVAVGFLMGKRPKTVLLQQPVEPTVSLLAKILSELQQERAAPEQSGAKVEEHEREIIRLRSGAPGRPSAMHLVEREFEQSAKNKQTEATVGEQARVLADWLPTAYPDAHPLTAKTISNRLCAKYREARRRSTPTREKRRTKGKRRR